MSCALLGVMQRVGSDGDDLKAESAGPNTRPSRCAGCRARCPAMIPGRTGMGFARRNGPASCGMSSLGPSSAIANS
jgi:hypothetical protein